MLTCASESLKLCAGSVLTIRVVCPAAASFTAKEADKLVLPTPPLPLIMMYLRAVPAQSSSKALLLISEAGGASVAAACRGFARGAVDLLREGAWLRKTFEVCPFVDHSACRGCDRFHSEGGRVITSVSMQIALVPANARA